MNDAVIPELQLLACSILAGLLCFFFYDLLLVVRIFLRKPLLLDKLEDVLYWCAASILVFVMIYRNNNGVIRSYSIAGMIAGMIFYRMLFQDRLVRIGQKQAERLASWGRKILEPWKNKKRELQRRRKQSKIERKTKRSDKRKQTGKKKAEKKEKQVTGRRKPTGKKKK